MFPALVGWVVVGALVGFVVSKIVNLRGDDPKLGIFVAVIGSLIGAIIYRMASGVEVRPWNSRSVFFAALGSVIGVILWHAIRSRTISHSTHVERRSH